MENLALVSSNPVMGLSYSPNYRTLSTKQCFGLPLLPPKPSGFLLVSKPRSKTILFAFSTPNSRRKSSKNEKKDNGAELFASTSATSQETTTSVGVNPQTYPPPSSSQFGSPLFWIGVGVGISAIFSFVSSWTQKKAMQVAVKTMMNQMGSKDNQFSNAAFSTGSPFPFPPPPTAGSSTSGFSYQRPSTIDLNASSAPSQATFSSPAASEATVSVDVSATKTEPSGAAVVENETETETKTEGKRSAFVDVSPEETFQNTAFENYSNSSSATTSENANFTEVVQNGAPSNTSEQAQSTPPGKNGSLLSVDTLEKMMEDPTVQKMVFPHLPAEMRDPATFKWMLQNPVYRQQLQEMLDNMGGTPEWDNRMVDNLKNFDLNSPEVKQQFDQIGLTPEEVISKIMANPDVAMAFQNPRVQQAIMDVSQNPMNIVNYQNDKEVMDVFNKIQQLFPGTAGPF
ncbi:protein TIC 40, chloroplastic-like [Chenopodium quinoa]|uniref:protein TIC 40, chloroplastic-like n=1 Tax=Chenopodium quinoa TaxID=63459 RepID=UPI000B7810A5|nr:protein TIC 40, chloroplastic-like [Chenopodium quinoa]